MNFRELLSSFKPGADVAPLGEKFRSAAAALAGVLLLGWGLRLLPEVGYPLSLLASMAAAAVLLFAVPHSPMAQPWPLLAGNVVSAIVGWACSMWISDVVVAAACAVGFSILLMHLTRSLHPPGAATAIVLVLNAPIYHQYGWLWAASVVLANILLFLVLAFVLNNLIHLGRYPVHRYQGAPKPMAGREQLTAEDVAWALGKMEGVTDVSEHALLEIYRLAAEHAQKRA